MTLVLDIGLLVCFLLTLAAGLRNGFFRELFALLGVIAGIWVGLRFTVPVLTHLPRPLQHSGLSSAIVFALIFLASFAVLSVTGAAFAALWEGKKPGALSRILGLVLGAARGGLLVLFLAAAVTLLAPKGSLKLGRSRILPYLTPGIVCGADAMPPAIREKLLRKWEQLPFPGPAGAAGVQAGLPVDPSLSR